MTEDVVARVRAREYAERAEGIFFNAASWGLLPQSTAEEVADLTHRRRWAHGFAEAELGVIQSRCRAAVAGLLGAEADEVALVPNTSYGVNLAAALVASGPPGTVVVSRGEFPANVLPWKPLEARGFHIDLVECDALGRPDEAELLRRVDRGEVRALAVSAVQFASGVRMDLRALGEACRRRGALFCVDAIQAVGAVPLLPREFHVDVLACGGQKWLCSPWGSGFAWLRRGLHDRFDPPMVSWLSMRDATRFEHVLHYRMDWLEDARRFELGTLGLQDYLGLARSAEIFLEMGVEAVHRHIEAVLEPLVNWIQDRDDVTPLTPLDPERRAGIVSFVPPSLDASVEALLAARVAFAVREGAIRFSPHFYNTRAEMEEVVGVLKGASAGSG